ncbi:MAG: hypothetical protein ABIL05_02615 [candidate division WOR-3 bacterium]
MRKIIFLLIFCLVLAEQPFSELQKRENSNGDFVSCIDKYGVTHTAFIRNNKLFYFSSAQETTCLIDINTILTNPAMVALEDTLYLSWESDGEKFMTRRLLQHRFWIMPHQVYHIKKHPVYYLR